MLKYTVDVNFKDDFVETDHPRGQPHNAGQFVKAGKVATKIGVKKKSLEENVAGNGYEASRSLGKRAKTIAKNRTKHEEKLTAAGWRHKGGGEWSHKEGHTARFINGLNGHQITMNILRKELTPQEKKKNQAYVAQLAKKAQAKKDKTTVPTSSVSKPTPSLGVGNNSSLKIGEKLPGGMPLEEAAAVAKKAQVATPAPAINNPDDDLDNFKLNPGATTPSATTSVGKAVKKSAAKKTPGVKKAPAKSVGEKKTTKKAQAVAKADSKPFKPANGYGVPVAKTSADLTAEYKKWQSGLTSEQAWTIDRYKNGSHSEINAALYDPYSSPSYKTKQQVEELEAALAPAVVPCDLKLYRGLSDEETQDILAQATEPGKTVNVPSFWSTSINENVAKAFKSYEGWLVDVEVQKGYKGAAYIHEIPDVKHNENEFLFNSGSKFLVMGKNETTKRITLRAYNG